MDEPTSLTATIAEQLATLPQDSPIRAVLTAMRDGHRHNQQRRARVLKHEDLRKRLTESPLNFTRADKWSGYVPPEWVNIGEDELLRSARIIQDGELRVRHNQLGRRTEGTILNDSARRVVLVEISTEAKRREQASAALLNKSASGGG